jgi:hypothetical protein
MVSSNPSIPRKAASTKDMQIFNDSDRHCTYLSTVNIPKALLDPVTKQGEREALEVVILPDPNQSC